MNSDKKMIRIGKASEQLGVSPTTLRLWVRRGMVPVMRSKTNRFFWTREMIKTIKDDMLTVFTNE